MPIRICCDHIQPKRLKPVAGRTLDVIKLLQSWVLPSLLVVHIQVPEELLKSVMDFMIQCLNSLLLCIILVTILLLRTITKAMSSTRNLVMSIIIVR